MEGAGDNDLPFAGFQASHFSTRQMVRLLLLRGDVLDAHVGQSPFVDGVAASSGHPATRRRLAYKRDLDRDR